MLAANAMRFASPVARAEPKELMELTNSLFLQAIKEWITLQSIANYDQGKPVAVVGAFFSSS
jgi:hypothetical protein